MIKLYYFYPACSLAAHIALEESGLNFEAHRVELKDPARAAEYKKINPKGTVPAIVTDGQMLLENVAILTYVDSLAPNAKLLPVNPMQRAQCMSFLIWCASAAHIDFRMSFRPERFGAPVEIHEGMKALGRSNYWADLQTIDHRLQHGRWIMGEDYTCADGYALRLYDWGRIAKYPMGELKSFGAFVDRMLLRPTVQRVLEREGSPLVAAVA